MRVAFLVQAHGNGAQVYEAARRLEPAGHRIFVHWDAKSREKPGPVEDRVIPGCVRVWHAGYSQVEATLRLLRAARQAGRFDYFWLMSGQCFPVRPATWLEPRLAGGLAYINHYPMPDDLAEKRLDRLEHWNFEGGWAAQRATQLAKRLPRRNWLKGLSLFPYAGSNWWALPADVVDYVLSYVDRHPRYVQFMRHASYPDEMFFQTIIAQMHVEDRIRPALFYARWSSDTGRPDHLQLSDIPDGEVFMARKLDTRLNPLFLDELPVP